jgi:hypothetical protein
MVLQQLGGVGSSSWLQDLWLDSLINEPIPGMPQGQPGLQMPSNGFFSLDPGDQFGIGGASGFDPQQLQSLDGIANGVGDPQLQQYVQKLQQMLAQSEGTQGPGGLFGEGQNNPFGIQGLGPNGGVDESFLEMLLMLADYMSSQMNSPARNAGSFGNGGGWSSGGPSGWSTGRSSNASDAGGSGVPLSQITQSVGGNKKAFDVATQAGVLGKNIADLKAGGSPISQFLDPSTPNNSSCANFVSACLQAAGQIPAGEKSDSVQTLSNNLSKDPNWQRVDPSQLKPGDVCCMAVPGEGSFGHVVMYAGKDKNGNNVFVGSNNDNPDGSQKIDIVPMNYSITAAYHYKGN